MATHGPFRARSGIGLRDTTGERACAMADLWGPSPPQTAATHWRHGTMTILPSGGHIGPLLHQTPAAADQITAFTRPSF